MAKRTYKKKKPDPNSSKLPKYMPREAKGTVWECGDVTSKHYGKLLCFGKNGNIVPYPDITLIEDVPKDSFNPDEKEYAPTAPIMPKVEPKAEEKLDPIKQAAEKAKEEFEQLNGELMKIERSLSTNFSGFFKQLDLEQDGGAKKFQEQGDRLRELVRIRNIEVSDLNRLYETRPSTDFWLLENNEIIRIIGSEELALTNSIAAMDLDISKEETEFKINQVVFDSLLKEYHDSFEPIILKYGEFRREHPEFINQPDNRLESLLDLSTKIIKLVCQIPELERIVDISQTPISKFVKDKDKKRIVDTIEKLTHLKADRVRLNKELRVMMKIPKSLKGSVKLPLTTNGKLRVSFATLPKFKGI